MSEIEMKELVKAEKREYARQWRVKNRDRALAHSRHYWERRAAAKLAAMEQSKGA